jgi:hypothetical protein
MQRCGFESGRSSPPLGAVYLHSSVCLLPDQGDIANTVGTLRRRVRDSGGNAQVLKIVLIDDTEEARIIAEQSADRDNEYGEVVERTGESWRKSTERRNGIGDLYRSRRVRGRP